MMNETTTTGTMPEMTIPDAIKIARQEAAKNTGEIRSALTMLADYAMPVIPHDEPAPEAPANEEEHHMSRLEAIGILMRLAASRKMSADDVTALQMGVRHLANKHFQRHRNWAKRRAAAVKEEAQA